MTHEIVSAHPRVVEVDQALADARAAQRKHQDRAAARVAEYRQAVAAWQAERRAAALEGRPSPPAPQEPEGDGAAAIVLERLEELRDERRRVLADIEGEVVAAAVDRESELLDRARGLLADLEPVVDELSSLHAAVRAVRVAADSVGAERVEPTRASRMVGRVDVAAVVEAVEYGGSLLAVAPPHSPVWLDADAVEVPADPASSDPTIVEDGRVHAIRTNRAVSL